jgi:GxxExxY protein
MNLKVVSTMEEKTEALATVLVDCAFQVHKNMRPGLLERIYEECFVHELKDRGLSFERQKPIALKYKHHNLDLDYKIDLIVENEIVVELKSVEKLNDLHKAQILSYMHLMNKRLGLLINFNVPLIKDGIKRIAL